ncbi:MAG: hypothetical protein Q8Q25_02105 [bacterium]|nr:hypothetical protein [bacterium]
MNTATKLSIFLFSTLLLFSPSSMMAMEEKRESPQHAQFAKTVLLKVVLGSAIGSTCGAYSNVFEKHLLLPEPFSIIVSWITSYSLRKGLNHAATRMMEKENIPIGKSGEEDPFLNNISWVSSWLTYLLL